MPVVKFDRFDLLELLQHGVVVRTPAILLLLSLL